MKGVLFVATAKKYYTIDEKNKVVIFDTTVKPTSEEREDVIMFKRMGYDVRRKINREVKKGSIASLKDADIRKLLASNKEALSEYDRLYKLGTKAGGGFFKARSAVTTQLKEAMNAKTSKK
jgi:hypothetical protein